jgi:ubiquinone/menaquinone biosynthesis C-methylase UbiE
MDPKQHWDSIFQHKTAEQQSWYRPHLERSLALVEASGLGTQAAVIDVGGGTSTLVDDLLARGYTDVTVLDLSEAALRATRDRLGNQVHGVHWIAADITRAELPEARFDFWHDRAVFHFLVDADARQRYVAAVRRALRPGGHIVVATFGPEGPQRCSGLDVVRYDAPSLHAAFGATFEKVGAFEETHTTPWGAEQEFVYCYCRKSV